MKIKINIVPDDENDEIYKDSDIDVDKDGLILYVDYFKLIDVYFCRGVEI